MLGDQNWARKLVKVQNLGGVKADFIYSCKLANHVRRENGKKDNSVGKFLDKVFCRILHISYLGREFEGGEKSLQGRKNLNEV